MDGIIDVVSNDVAYQIIIGTHVSEVHEELVSMLGISGQAPDSRTGGRKNPFKAALDLVSESMTPLLEPIIAAGMLAGLLSLVSLTGLVSADSPTYIVLDSIRGGRVLLPSRIHGHGLRQAAECQPLSCSGIGGNPAVIFHKRGGRP